MSEPALRLLEDDGTPEEIARLREIIADLQRQVASLKRMLQASFEEAKIKDDTIAKYHRENTGLKTRLIRQEKQDAQDEVDHPNTEGEEEDARRGGDDMH